MDDASAHPWDAQRLKHQKVWAEAVASFVNLQCETRRPFITVCCNGMPPEAQPPSMAQHHLEVNVFHGSGYNCLRQEEAGGGGVASAKARWWCGGAAGRGGSRARPQAACKPARTTVTPAACRRTWSSGAGPIEG